MRTNELIRRLAPENSPAALIDAIWDVRREGLRELEYELTRLLEHESPIVREEAINLLFVKWRVSHLRNRATDLLRSDPDFGPKSAAAWGLAVSSTSGTRKMDIEELRRIVLDETENPLVRQTAYQGLYQVAGLKVPQVGDDFDMDREADLNWVRGLT